MARRSIQQLEVALAAAKADVERCERARQHDLYLADLVHRSMLPGRIQHAKVDIDVRYLPVERVGGDYCQVLFPSDSDCYVTICDVSGHGIGPALLATRFSSEVRRLIFDQRDPAEIVEGANKFVIEHFCGTELQVSFFVMRLDFEAASLTYSGAGHPSPLLIRRGGGPIEVLRSQNLLIGVHEKCLSDSPEATKQVDRGDRLIIFTDGLPQTTNPKGESLGVEGVVRMATVTCAGDLFDMADCFLNHIESFRDSPPEDDMTLIVAEIT
ncbi:MAG: PP2C family protein-serine/threonine phosphatase [Pirellulales bacterium]